MKVDRQAIIAIDMAEAYRILTDAVHAAHPELAVFDIEAHDGVNQIFNVDFTLRASVTTQPPKPCAEPHGHPLLEG